MNVIEEREQAARSRFPREAKEAFGEAKYRANGVVVQVVFFLLTCVGIGAMYAFLEALDFDDSAGVITGVIAIAIGEVLIRVRRWFGTGVEAALWLGGLVSIISELPSSGAPEAMLVLGAAAALAGWRVRNPLFGAVAAMFVAEYAEKRADLGVVCALAIALAAGLLLLREWKRPSTEWLFIALVVLLPLFGRITADPQWRTTTITLYGVFGALLLTLGVVKRHHALLVSGLLALAVGVADFGALLDAPLESELLVAGALLLAGSYRVSRTLRGRTTGIVVTPAKLTPVDEVFESAGGFVAGHATQSIDSPAAGEARPAGDGRFGGAGASDGY
ncbi:MAG TPA: hypothetical protein VHW00_12475 [Thermoanaerobaculia bacterium]|nr:hypothetical protein [Thermoanaerobaculia bacterium]